jgi:hypothetical protein
MSTNEFAHGRLKVTVNTHMYDCRQDITRRPCAADATLSTTDKNQNVFTAADIVVDVVWYENWMKVAVTLEKKVAMVVMVKDLEV